MTVVLRDSIQTKPLPIANAIIHVRLTRLVTSGENFLEKPIMRANIEKLSMSAFASVFLIPISVVEPPD
jgi:hypothetical protein